MELVGKMTKQGMDSEATYKELRSQFPTLPLNEVLCGDCLEVMRSFPDESITMIFVDPPYNEVGKDEVFTDIYSSWIDDMITEFKRLLVKTGSLVFCGRPPILNYLIVKSLEKLFVLNDWVTWHKLDSITHTKSYFSRNYEVFAILNFPFIDRKFNSISVPSKTKHYGKTRNIGSIWQHPKVTAHHKEDVGHPTQKPEKLVGYLIKALSDENDLILDPMCGSGTTLVMAHKLGRKWIGIDFNNNYVETAKKRLESVGATSSQLEQFMESKL